MLSAQDLYLQFLLRRWAYSTKSLPLETNSLLLLPKSKRYWWTRKDINVKQYSCFIVTIVICVAAMLQFEKLRSLKLVETLLWYFRFFFRNRRVLVEEIFSLTTFIYVRVRVVCQFKNDYVLIRLMISVWMDLDSSFLPPRSTMQISLLLGLPPLIIPNWIKIWSLLSSPHSLPLHLPLLPPPPRWVSNLSYYVLSSFNHKILTSCCLNPKLPHRLTTPLWTEILVLPMVLEPIFDHLRYVDDAERFPRRRAAEISQART